MYKFIAQNALIENMYLLMSIFIKNKISPIFVFDGKPPPEKRRLINQRRILKKDAEKKYSDLQLLLSTASAPLKQDIEIEMESLKKKFIRIKESDVSNVKSLMRAYGASYCDAEGEADKLCVYMVKTGKAWACLSDDMDMFVYGCPRVLRHVSLLKHSAILYDLDLILGDLNMSMNDFRQVTVISGTDYNINPSTSLGETMKWYNQFKLSYHESSENELLFYNWLHKFTKYIRSYDDLISVHSMFYIDDNDDNLASREIQSFTGNVGIMQTVLKLDGFVFA